MNDSNPAKRVRAARTQLEAAERELALSSRPWLERLQKHRQALTVAGGFISGLALVVLPSRWWARAGAVAGASAASVARSVLTPMLMGAALAWLRPDAKADAATKIHTDEDSIAK
ncbi:MAG TPA: hypothetical protein VFN13_04810 [Rudaea sp.]|nr:hypothetical protein [Rudaea sp.]